MPTKQTHDRFIKSNKWLIFYTISVTYILTFTMHKFTYFYMCDIDKWYKYYTWHGKLMRAIKFIGW